MKNFAIRNRGHKGGHGFLKYKRGPWALEVYVRRATCTSARAITHCGVGKEIKNYVKHTKINVLNPKLTFLKLELVLNFSKKDEH